MHFRTLKLVASQMALIFFPNGIKFKITIQDSKLLDSKQMLSEIIVGKVAHKKKLFRSYCAYEKSS